MSTMHEMQPMLAHKAYKLRLQSIRMTTQAGSGHPTSCLSAADIVATLFFYAMKYDPDHFDNPCNDHFVLSKGHAAPLLYAAWHEVGVVSEQELMTYRDSNSPLEGHPTFRFSYTEAATGSLGIGLSIGLGMALTAQRDNLSSHTYVLLGDSELSEGSVWEAVELAAHYNVSNLIAIVDVNRLGQSIEALHGYHLNRYVDIFTAFGWKVHSVDGHDIHHLMGVCDKARAEQDKPTVILAKTVKGYGVARVENKMGYHGKPFSKEELPEIEQELQERFASAAAYHMPEGMKIIDKPDLCEDSNISCDQNKTIDPKGELGEHIATRKAYGNTLAALGSSCKALVSLDAEVKNSTYAEFFEDKYPERFFQCYIAEQNMVAMGVGMARCGKIPFISTFGAFFTRAHDQIRMAAIGQSPLRLVGSHAGVSIGQDGPSQMALEDIALMRTLPDSVVLYPSDAISTARLMERMLSYHQGISYLRTTRMATPVYYTHDQEFTIGGCNVLFQTDNDRVCIVAAGVTLWEAVKASEALIKEGISIAVIDLYSIKPLDAETLIRVAQSSQKRIITVEDHYSEGGLGEAVAAALRNTDITIQSLAVRELPRSGKPKELLSHMQIDAAAIIRAVKA